MIGSNDDDYNPSGSSGSNALIMPAVKKTGITKKANATPQASSKKQKPLSATRRKKLEKKNEKREKLVNRQSILDELKQFQLTDKQRGMMIPVTASTKKMKS